MTVFMYKRNGQWQAFDRTRKKIGKPGTKRHADRELTKFEKRKRFRCAALSKHL